LSKGLVIVESPAKAKTIQKYLGKGFTVDASFGHVKDLPKSSLGVDVENDFETEYVVIPGKEKVLAKLKKLALSADHIYLAPDPDREGEAIAAHLADELGEDSGKKKKGKKKSATKAKADYIGDGARVPLRLPSNTPVISIATWSTRSKLAACSIVSWDTRSPLFCGTRSAAAFPPDGCRLSRSA
jgi:hypothetical protein